MLRLTSFRNFVPILAIISLFAILSAAVIAADDEIFSGPQVGEPLPSFQVRAVNTDRAERRSIRCAMRQANRWCWSLCMTSIVNRSA